MDVFSDGSRNGPRSIGVEAAAPDADVWRGRFQTFQSIAVLDRAAKVVQ
jgi:hypothetical protein